MVFRVLVHAPGVVDALARHDILDRQHRGHHRVVLVVVAVHAVASDKVQRGMLRFQFFPHDLNALGIVLVIDGVGLFLAHDRTADDIRRIAQAEDFHFLRGERDEIVVGRCPEAVAFEAEIFKTDTGDIAVGHHFGRPRTEILNAADLHLAVVDVDPVVWEQVLRLDLQRHGEEVAVLQPAGV